MTASDLFSIYSRAEWYEFQLHFEHVDTIHTNYDSDYWNDSQFVVGKDKTVQTAWSCKRTVHFLGSDVNKWSAGWY